MGDLKGSTGRRLAAGGAIAGVCSLLLAAPAFAAATYTVSGYGDGNGSCSPTSPGTWVCPTLRAAATAAPNGSTIQLSAGTYQLTLGQLPIGATTIQGAGPGGPNGTTIEQTDGTSRVIQANAGPAALVGLEVTGGHLAQTWSSGTTWRGGGILAQGPLVLEDVLLTGNEVEAPAGPSSGDAGDGAEGGGIDYVTGSLPGSSITNSVITNNAAVAGAGGTGGLGGTGDGGGIANSGNGALQITTSTISQNQATGGDGGHGAGGGAGEGGGIFTPSPVTLTASALASNTAIGGAGGTGSTSGGGGDGGGLFNPGGLDQIVNTTVFGNSAQAGAAVLGGNAQGGGVFDHGPGGLILQSDTVDANQASNLFVSSPSTFTIHDTIVSGGAPSNCALSAPPSSESYNLEDDAADQCGFSSANHDLVGANPQLPPSPSDNGGPTQTLAPGTTSPVLGAGGMCFDPTSSPPGQPLASDQRGQPRHDPCDIGGFEAQPPASTSRPLVSGVTTRGHTLSCTSGTWGGDGPFAFAYQWLRDGVAIASATAGTYRIRAVDAGHTLACRVTATHYGSTRATSALASVTPNPVATLLKLTMSGTTVVISLGCRGATGQRCSGVLKLTVVEKLRGKNVIALLARRQGRFSRIAIVGRRGYSISSRSAVNLRLGLRSLGLGLLRRFLRLPLTLTVTQTLPAGTRTTASRRLSLPPVRGTPSRA